MALRFSYKYNAKNLAPDPYEKDPVLLWWTSAYEGWSKEIPVIWKDELHVESVIHTITIPYFKGKIRTDDTIGFECMVLAPNQDKQYVRSKAGSGCFYMDEFVDDVENGSTNEKYKINLVLNTYEVDGKPFEKGTITVFLNGAVILGDPPEFRKVKNGYLQEEKEMMIEMNTILMASIIETLIPYDESAKQYDCEFPPTYPSLERIHAPIWTTERGILPGSYFWVHYTKYPPQEEFFENLATIALSRAGILREDFIESVKNQFQSTSKQINPDFFDVITMTADMFTILSTSLPYIGDFTNTKKRGVSQLFDEGEQVAIESFHDALRMLGGDCEDLACLIDRVAMGFELGDPVLKNNGIPWRKHGGWKSQLLDSIQRIAHIMVPMGSLGSVVGAYLDEKDKEKHKPPPIFQSQEDNNVEIGAHMWWEWIPLFKVENLISRANGERSFIMEDRDRLPWEANLPHFIGEGTGYLSPILKPIGDYFTGNMEEMNKRVTDHELKLAAIGNIGSETVTIKQGQIQRLQSMLKYIPDSRLSRFYRETTNCFSNKFLRAGYNFSEFEWIQTSPRISEVTNKPSSSHKNWTWGVLLRDKLYDKENLALLVTPGYSDVLLSTIHTILRQLPPLAPLYLDSNKAKLLELEKLRKETVKKDVVREIEIEIKEYETGMTQFEEICEEFKLQCESLEDTLERLVLNRKKKDIGSYVNVYFHSVLNNGLIKETKDDIEKSKSIITLNDELIKGIKDDIEKNKSIITVEVIPEIVTGEIFNIRLKIWVNLENA